MQIKVNVFTLTLIYAIIVIKVDRLNTKGGARYYGECKCNNPYGRGHEAASGRTFFRFLNFLIRSNYGIFETGVEGASDTVSNSA